MKVVEEEEEEEEDWRKTSGALTEAEEHLGLIGHGENRQAIGKAWQVCDSGPSQQIG